MLTASEMEKGCKDEELCKRHLEFIKGHVSNQTFPRSEEEMKQVTDSYGFILDGIVRNPNSQGNNLDFLLKLQWIKGRSLKKKQRKKRLETNLLKEFWIDVTEFIKQLCRRSDNTKFTTMLEKYKYFINAVPSETISENPDLFESWAPIMADILLEGKNTDAKLMALFVPRCVTEMLQKIKPKPGYDKYMIPLLTGMVKYPVSDMAEAIESVMRNSKLKKIWSWKKNVEGARKMIITINQVDLPYDGDVGEVRNINKAYGNMLCELIEQLELVKVNYNVMPELTELVIFFMEKKSEHINELVKCISGKLDLKKNKEIIPDILKRFEVLYKDPDYPWSEVSSHCGDNLFEALIKAYNLGNEIPSEVNGILISMFLFAMEDDRERIDYERRMLNIFGMTLVGPVDIFATLHSESDTLDIVVPLIPSLFKMLEEDFDNIEQGAAFVLFRIIAMQSPQLLASDEDFNNILKYYINVNQSYDVLDAIFHIYPYNSKPMCKWFQDIFAMFGLNATMDNGFLQFFLAVADLQPELFTKENVEKFKDYVTDLSVGMFTFSIVEKISQKNPAVMEEFVVYLMGASDLPPHTGHWVKEMMSNVAINQEKLLKPTLEYFIKRTQTEYDEAQRVLFFVGMRKLAHEYGPEPFKPYRDYLDERKENGSSNVKMCVTTLIDELEGRNLETFVTELGQQRGDIDNLDQRVLGTEIVVDGIVQQADRHEEQIKDVQVDVANVNQRVDDIEEDIVEVKEKVEEIDMKTMSNAPIWSRDVTKLLNPESDHDWRLLASRLGYTDDDIRAWATQSDPCMALLSEWYATHRTREATSGVLNVLQKMNRIDAAVIVENAMKAAEDAVEDEDFEYQSPPPVFLSYQWGHQNEVKLLRQHLQMAGYECWMDIGQMGGGDKLFEKIDAGIRGAKVVICCVSEKYAKSPNCNREVNLAVNLHKPMIPLQMEKLAWPPAGSMSPIFSEYLYIRFYSGGSTEGTYWVESKFQELLMQLQFNNVVPDEKLITKEYKNWWIPIAEEVVIKKQDEKVGKQTNVHKTKEDTSKEGEIKPPEVFLSYQWGKQRQIQALYKQLTGLGFHCWMDIHQMGGGDSLYEKIDRGVRGCKVVLSSVTQKYSLSANCRREVSLVDALKKPVIPLLLEKIDWPPSGPMSMVFTQLLYIDFSNDPEVQMKWTGKEFDELITKLKVHVPGSNGTKTEENNSAVSKQNKVLQSNDKPDQIVTQQSNAISHDSATQNDSHPAKQTNPQPQTKSHDSATQNDSHPANKNDNANKNSNKTSPTKKSGTCCIL